MVTTEYFEEGTVPTDYCDVHVRVSVCSASGMLASQFCPEELRVTSAYIKRPEPAEGTTDDTPYTVPEGSTPTELCPIHVNGEESSVPLDSLTIPQADPNAVTDPNAGQPPAE